MNNGRIVCIDLGSSYTKIGVRRDWNVPSVVVEDLSVALKSPSFVVPSVVAREDGARQESWYVGAQAAEMRRTEKREIFRNWKASLFGAPESDGAAQTAKAGSLSQGRAKEIAIHMLRLLRASVEDGKWREVAEYPARLCVPDFGTAQQRDELCRAILLEAGWTPCGGRVAVTEPEANVIGVVTRGLNRTWLPKSGSGRSIRFMQMQEMLETGVKKAYRRMSDNYDVMITDVGAYTTDFGFVAFDPSFRKDYGNHPTVKTRSVALGVTVLDSLVVSRMPAESQRAIRSMPTTVWERAKIQLYSGRIFKFRSAGEPEVSLGAEGDLHAIDDGMAEFTRRICEARAGFVKSIGVKTINDELVTGGGSYIPSLRDALRASCGNPIRDLLDPKEPERAVLEGTGPMSAKAKAQRLLHNSQLVRTASAIGGASVFFED